MATAVVRVRGCGTRQKGGIYAEVPLGADGMPVEHFLVEPPVVVDAEAMGLTPIGVSLVDRRGAGHVLDWVGEAYYPNVADMVEEIRAMGLSRRLSRNLDFPRLTPESRLFLLHRRAHVDNWMDYENTDDFCCPKARMIAAFGRRVDLGGTPYAHPPGMCIGTWWHDVEDGVAGGEAVAARRADGTWLSHHDVRREMPSFAYQGFARPEGVTPQYQLAVFASFPIARLAVVNDPEGRTHEAALAAARRSGLSVSLEEA